MVSKAAYAAATVISVIIIDIDIGTFTKDKLTQDITDATKTLKLVEDG